MCTMMTVILAKSDYLKTANDVYYNLQENEKIFESEAIVLNYIKCMIIRNEEIDDFYVDGIYVNVYENSNGYELYFEDYVMNIDVYDKQIINFDIRRL